MLLVSIQLTAITNWARKISTVGGSLRDVQLLAGHSALGTTQRYIEANEDAKRRVVELIRCVRLWDFLFS